jgi:manganese/iron transport system permease protein
VAFKVPLEELSRRLISYHANVAAGGTIVLVATGVFGLVWLLAPTHGVIASILTRRRAMRPTRPASPMALEEREVHAHDGR